MLVRQRGDHAALIAIGVDHADVHVVLVGLRLRFAGRVDDLAHRRAQHAEQQRDHHQRTQAVTRDVAQQRVVQPRTFPEGNVLRLVGLAHERGVHHRHRVAARGVEAHGFLHQRFDARQGGGIQRGHHDLAVLARARHVVDQHGGGDATHAPGGLPGVLQRAIHLEVAGGAAAGLHRGGGVGRGRGVRAGRGVAGGAGDAFGAGAGDGVLADLFAADLGRIVGEGLAGFLGDREIHVHGDFGIHAAGTGQRFQQFADAVVEGGFQLAHALELGGIERGLAVRIADGEHAAALVDHGDAFGRQVGDGRRHQVHDGVHLVAFQHGAGAQVQHDRRAGDFALAGEGAGLGDGQVHARIAHRAQGGDGAHQIGFQCVLVARVLDELADAEAGIALHHLEAQAAALGQAGARQLQASVVQVLFRHGDRAGGLVQLERDLRRAQHVSGFGGGLGVQAGVERGVGRLLRPEEHEQAQRNRAGDHQQRAHLLEHARILDLGQRRTGLVGGQRFLQGFLGQREGHGDGSVR